MEEQVPFDQKERSIWQLYTYYQSGLPVGDGILTINMIRLYHGNSIFGGDSRFWIGIFFILAVGAIFFYTIVHYFDEILLIPMDNLLRHSDEMEKAVHGGAVGVERISRAEERDHWRKGMRETLKEYEELNTRLNDVVGHIMDLQKDI